MKIITLIIFIAFIFFPFSSSALNSHSMDFEADSTQYLSIADSASLVFTDVTVEAWINLETMPSGATNAVIAQKFDNNSQREWFFRIRGADNSVDFPKAFDNDCTSVAGGVIAHNLVANKWIHIAGVMRVSAGAFDYYENGRLLGTVTGLATTAIPNCTAAMWIGALNNNGSPITPIDGKMDDVRIWNSARTAQQIQQSYQGEFQNIRHPNLVAYYKLNNALTDETPNANNATNNNGAIFVRDFPFSNPDMIFLRRIKREKSA